MLVVLRRVTGEEILDLSTERRWVLTVGRGAGWRLVRVRPTAIVVAVVVDVGGEERRGEGREVGRRRYGWCFRPVWEFHGSTSGRGDIWGSRDVDPAVKKSNIEANREKYISYPRSAICRSWEEAVNIIFPHPRG